MFLLYGANGYTGKLIAEEARRRGLDVTVAGRNEARVREVAEKLGYPWRAFPLDDPARLREGLAGMHAVLLAAGPFSTTSAPVLQACLETGVHYLDITGEFPVFEGVFARDADAKARGVTFVPGVGFDVVPTDCMAKLLSEALPGAVRLELAFAGGEISRGTAKTAVEGLGVGGAVREGGRIKRVPLAWRTREVPFQDRRRHVVSIPWGDISTAYHSTRIPDIITYIAMPPESTRAMKLARPLMPILRLHPVQRAMKAWIESKVEGPDEEARRSGRVQVWGRVEDAAGKAVEGTLVTPEGYSFTARAAVECTTRLLASSPPRPGAYTPSVFFGARLVEELGSEARIAPA